MTGRAIPTSVAGKDATGTSAELYTCPQCGWTAETTADQRNAHRDWHVGHATRNRVAEWCREDLPTGERCNKPAEFILWGKLFPPEGLGPRCYDHAAKHAGHRALTPSQVTQYAIYVLPRPS